MYKTVVILTLPLLIIWSTFNVIVLSVVDDAKKNVFDVDVDQLTNNLKPKVSKYDANRLLDELKGLRAGGADGLVMNDDLDISFDISESDLQEIGEDEHDQLNLEALQQKIDELKRFSSANGKVNSKSLERDVVSDYVKPERQSPRLLGFEEGPRASGNESFGEDAEALSDKLTKKEKYHLRWDYNSKDKDIAYSGCKWADQFPEDSYKRYNSLAVFPESNDPRDDPDQPRFHGRLGVYANGRAAWGSTCDFSGKGGKCPKPVTELDEADRLEAMARGGFYLDLTNSLPMDRPVVDFRRPVCKEETYDYQTLPDASIVITVYNEPLSTLLRTVHSVLNNTPPSILREIIIVDDHSDLPENEPGDDLDKYVRLLPKVKILRLPERRGLVWARLAGAQSARGDVLVILDSHVEVNKLWLEPQLKQITLTPNAFVMPQIMGLDPEDWRVMDDNGIGCWVSWHWSMVENSTFNPNIQSAEATPSPAMAGGLFAVDRQFFWDIGGYDKQFSMWGSENVELGFRSWMCGGQILCTPCSLTYHVYRKDGVGYDSPSEAVWRNKIRSARLWMDDHYAIAREFIKSDREDILLGDTEDMLEFKKERNCKSFQWFLENVDPNHDFQSLDDVEFFGEIRITRASGNNIGKSGICVDSLSAQEGGVIGTYPCHNTGGNQRWLKDRKKPSIMNVAEECISLERTDGPKVEVEGFGQKNLLTLSSCDSRRAKVWRFEDSVMENAKGKQLVYDNNNQCVGAIGGQLVLVPCDAENQIPDIATHFHYDKWTPEKVTPLVKKTKLTLAFEE